MLKIASHFQFLLPGVLSAVGAGSGGAAIYAEPFSIDWERSLVALETGWYEFRVTTPNGAWLYLKGERQDGDGNHRDASAAKR